jgi:Protein of Unknown function (DUF2784)
MLDRLLADAVVVFHVLFIAFAIGGGVFVLRWRRVMWLHLPAVAWAVLVEVMSWPCPLTPLENHFRRRGGEAGYHESFVEHYIMPVLYPEGLTDRIQLAIGAFVFAVNVAVYSIVIWRWKSRRGAQTVEVTGPSTPAPGARSALQ